MEYLRDFNATKAAKRAGYAEKSAHSQAHDLLKKPEIKQSIQDALAEHDLTTWRVLAEAAKVAYADSADYLTISDGGEIQAVAMDQLQPGASRAIKGIKETSTILETEAGSLKKSTLEYVMHDKMRALDILDRRLNALKLDANAVMGSMDPPPPADLSQSTEDIIAKIRNRIGK